MIALRNGYHGGSPSAMGLTSHHTWKLPTLQGPYVHHALCPEPYRSPLGGTPEEIAAASAADIGELIRYSTPGRIAAFIAEPIQGVGGVTSAAPNYFREAYRIAREHGGLCIADEVQTGFGRTGEHYWGFQNFGVVPDIVTMAKGFGNGVPLAAVTTRREIAEVLAQRLHFNTFGGNPVSMAAGLAVMEVIEEEGLQRNAQVVGGRLRDGLERLAREHRLIGDVRGMGLMLGVELVTDRAHPHAGDRGDAPGAGGGARDGRAARQGRPRRQRAPDQAADVHHRGRRGLRARRAGPGLRAGGSRSYEVRRPFSRAGAG